MIIDRVRESRAGDRPRLTVAPRPLMRRRSPPVDAASARHREVREWATRLHPGVIPIGEAARGELATVAGIVRRVRVDPRDRRIDAVIHDATGELIARWPMRERLPPLLPGRGVLVRGRLRRTPVPEMLSPRLVVQPQEEISPGVR